jgi:multiple sugar transport system substrate-binding protein
MLPGAARVRRVVAAARGRTATRVLASGLLCVAGGFAPVHAAPVHAAPVHAAAWSLAEAAKPYRGETIRCVGDGYAPFIAYQKLSDEFTRLTGINVEWEVADLGAMRQKMVADVMNDTGVYDCDEVTSLDVGLWIARGFVVPMFKFLDDPKLRDRQFDPWTAYVPETLAFSSMSGGKIYGLPYHFIPRFMVVRKDIAACTDEQAGFKARYGYELPLKPADWKTFHDVVEFFTRKAGQLLCGKVLAENFYGTAVSFKRHIATQYDFEEFLDGFGGTMFAGDGPLKTGTAQGFEASDQVAFDSPAAIQALTYWLSLLKYVPPGYLEYTWDNTFSDMCKGTLYTYGTFGDTTPYLEDGSSAGCPAVAGKLAYYPIPGTHQTGAEGQTWIIPTSSEHPEATFLFLQWLASAEVQRRCQTMGCTSPERAAWYGAELDHEDRTLITREIIEKGYLIARAHPPALTKISALLVDDLQAAALGKMSAAEALQDAARKSREAMHAHH